MMNLIDEIKDAKTIAIIGHVRPDGDCIGSTTALYKYINNYSKEISIDLVLDDFRNVYSQISVVDCIRNQPKYKNHDVCFCLDCGALERLGRFAYIFNNAKKRIVIDHHVTTKDFGDITLVDHTKSSTCEYLYNFLDKKLIDKDVASSLFTGLISDTGVFRYSCTSPSSFKMASELMEYGINNCRIIEESFYSRTYKSSKFLAKCIIDSKLIFDDKVIYTIATKNSMKEIGITNTDIEGVVEILRDTDSVDVAIFAYEIEEDRYKLSLRSKSIVDVSKVCASFGGGGHVRAAGCTLIGKFEELFSNVLDEVKKQL